MLGHGRRPACDPVEIARRALVLEIAPALKRAIRPRLHQHHLWLKREMAAADTFLVDKGPDVDEPLPAHDLATDDPIKRAAVAQLLGALRHHARGVDVLVCEPDLLGALV